jgi:hypothetical protein
METKWTRLKRTQKRSWCAVQFVTAQHTVRTTAETLFTNIAEHLTMYFY